MKTLRSNEDISKARELAALIEERKAAEKRERSLKDYFLAMGETVIRVGDCLITTKDCQTTSIDRPALTTKFGEQFVTEYTKITEYKRLEITRDVVA